MLSWHQTGFSSFQRVSTHAQTTVALPQVLHTFLGTLGVDSVSCGAVALLPENTAVLLGEMVCIWELPEMIRDQWEVCGGAEDPKLAKRGKVLKLSTKYMKVSVQPVVSHRCSPANCHWSGEM